MVLILDAVLKLKHVVTLFQDELICITESPSEAIEFEK